MCPPPGADAGPELVSPHPPSHTKLLPGCPSGGEEGEGEQGNKEEREGKGEGDPLWKGSHHVEPPVVLVAMVNDHTEDVRFKFTVK